MTTNYKDDERADRAIQERGQDAHDTRVEAFDKGFISYAEIFGSAEIAAPVEAALASWRHAMKIAQRANDAAELGATRESEAA